MKGILELFRTPKTWMFAAVLAAAPFSISQKGIVVNEAVCEQSDGTCCPEWGSICNIGQGDHENYYAKLQGGSCRP